MGKNEGFHLLAYFCDRCRKNNKKQKKKSKIVIVIFRKEKRKRNIKYVMLIISFTVIVGEKKTR